VPELLIKVGETVMSKLTSQSKRLGLTKEELGAKGVELMVEAKDVAQKVKQGNNTKESEK